MSATDQLKEKGAEALVNMIDVTVKTMSDVVDFSKQQIPDVLHQLLMWKAVESLVGFILPLILAIALLSYCLSFWKSIPKQLSRDRDGRAPWIADEFQGADGALYGRYWFRGYVCFVLGILASIVAFFSFNLDWLQIWIAPKVYLIQYAAELIKK
jgi:hypothetical protein